MSLFDTLAPSALPVGMSATTTATVAAPLPPPPVLDASAERALIELEKAKLRAADAAPPPPQVVGCGLPGCGVGCARGWISTGNDGGFIQCKCRGLVAPAVGVTPPDAPAPAPLLQAAAPLPAAAMLEISDPVLLQTVVDHAAEHKRLEEVKAAEEQAAKVAAGTNVWCAESSQRLVLTMEMALSRKYTCSCTKVISLKPSKQTDGSYQATLPRHKPVNKVESAPPQIIVEEVEEQTEMVLPPPPPASLMAVPPPPPPPPTNGTNGHTSFNELLLNQKFDVEKMKRKESDMTIALLQSIDSALHELVSIARNLKIEAVEVTEMKA